jgi:predicted MFS family arabinose efflux permease
MTAASSSQTGIGHSRTVVTVVVGAGVLAALQVGKAPIATPLLQADFGIDLAAAGWLTAIFALLGLVGGIPAGALVSAAGDRRILIFGLLSTVLGAATGATAPTFSILLISRVLEGLGFLLITIAGPAILQRVVSTEQRDVAFAFWSCFMPTGMALAMILGPLFTEWRLLWWTIAGLTMMVLGVSVLTLPAGALKSVLSWQKVASDALAVSKQKGPILLALCFALYSLMFFALFSFLPMLLMDRMGIAHGTAGVLSALASAANVIGNLAAGYCLAHGIARSRLIAGAGLIMGLSALGIFLPILADMPTFSLCLVFSAVGGLIPATLLASAPLVVRSSGLTPVVIGLVMQGSNLGQVVGPVAVGGAIEAFGWAAAAVTVLVSGLLVIAVAYGLRTILNFTEQGGQ